MVDLWSPYGNAPNQRPTHTGPGNYINLCGPHMLSIAGRCFTFDMSAATWRSLGFAVGRLMLYMN